MNWLLPALRDSSERATAGYRPRDDGFEATDTYGDVPLGVECAWPEAREVPISSA
jgi:hypothetical protein